MIDTIWVLELTRKRRQGQPVEIVGVTTGIHLQALVAAKVAAKTLKVPMSWIEVVPYRRAKP